MIPDMSDVLKEWSLPVTRKIVTVTTVDFEETETVVSSIIQAVVQPADMEKLKVANIDYRLEYVQIHTEELLLDIGDFLEDIEDWPGVKFKVIGGKNYSRYGYREMVGEECK